MIGQAVPLGDMQSDDSTRVRPPEGSFPARPWRSDASGSKASSLPTPVPGAGCRKQRGSVIRRAHVDREVPCPSARLAREASAQARSSATRAAWRSARSARAVPHRRCVQPCGARRDVRVGREELCRDPLPGRPRGSARRCGTADLGPGGWQHDRSLYHLGVGRRSGDDRGRLPSRPRACPPTGAATSTPWASCFTRRSPGRYPTRATPWARSSLATSPPRRQPSARATASCRRPWTGSCAPSLRSAPRSASAVAMRWPRRGARGWGRGGEGFVTGAECATGYSRSRRVLRTCRGLRPRSVQAGSSAAEPEAARAVRG